MTGLVAVTLCTAVSPGTSAYGPVHRVRTVLLNPDTGARTVDEHVRVRLPAPKRWSPLGDVLIGHGTGPSGVTETAAAHPGALVVAAHRGSRCWLRFGPDGTVIEFESRGAGEPAEEWAAVASLAHSWLVAGLSVGGFGSSARLWCSDSPSPNCRSRCREDSASSERDRPTEV